MRMKQSYNVVARERHPRGARIAMRAFYISLLLFGFWNLTVNRQRLNTEQYVYELILPYTNTSSTVHPIEEDRHSAVASAVAFAENVTNYQGILLITHLGEGEGTGTAFFNLVVDQLIYAGMYNLKPVIMPDNLSLPCFDANVHTRHLETQTFLLGEATPITGAGGMACRLLVNNERTDVPYPGPPQWDQNDQNITVTGNTLWTTYFRPLTTTKNKDLLLPAVNLQSYLQGNLGVHKCSPFGVRSWPFRGLPVDVRPSNNGTLQDWFLPMRLRASRIVDKYFDLQPEISALVEKANPASRSGGRRCLAIHIRGTDKGNGRIKVPLERFRDYVEVFDGDVYLATDDANVVQNVTNWITTNNKKGRRLLQQGDTFRSNSSVPTFLLIQNNTHRTNVESLVDIYAMARCSFLLHGFSAMSEAVMYLNIGLHNRSVNLDDPGRMSIQEFRTMVGE